MNIDNKYVKRLVKEWNEHGEIIVATDYDSTISPYHTVENKEDIDRTISLINKSIKEGAYIVIYTCCDESRYSDIIKYCQSVGFTPNSINKNPIELPYGNHSKPYANIYLDDRGGLNEALDILECAIYQMRGEKNKNSILQQSF